MRQLFADPASLGATGVDPMSSDAYLLASAFANKYGLGDNAVGNTLGGAGRMGVR
jgi:hypothetical protein